MEHKIYQRFPLGNEKRKWKQKNFILSQFSAKAKDMRGALLHCKEAGFLMNADGDFVVVPSLNIPRDYIKGNVGAGDAFAAGCLYGLYHGFDDEKLLRFASCASAANLSAPDSVSGMKCAADLEKIENMFERRVMS